MSPRTKAILLYGCKYLGLFSFARGLTRRALRIVCYHGVAARDEHLWRPQLYVEPHRLARRLDYLKRAGFHVISLDQAVSRLPDGSWPPHAVVLTVDDGFRQFWLLGAPEFLTRNLPVTVYVTTYHSVKGTPIFGLALRYVMWESGARELHCSGLGIPGLSRLNWRSEQELEAAAEKVTSRAESSLDEPGRQRLLSAIGERLRVDMTGIIVDGIFSIMSIEEIRKAAERGVDIQLHTHRHRFPPDRQVVEREIEDNRRTLAPAAGHALADLCYPSGEYHPAQFPWLRELGIRSGMTCDPGFNNAGAEPLRLRRFLDNSTIPDIVFEAEMSGFLELARRATGRK